MHDDCTVYVKTDGTPVETGNCVMPDSYVTTFTVTVRSMSGISANALKDVIQGKYEVTNCEKTNGVIVVK